MSLVSTLDLLPDFRYSSYMAGAATAFEGELMVLMGRMLDSAGALAAGDVKKSAALSANTADAIASGVCPRRMSRPQAATEKLRFSVRTKTDVFVATAFEPLRGSAADFLHAANGCISVA